MDELLCGKTCSDGKYDSDCSSSQSHDEEGETSGGIVPDGQVLGSDEGKAFEHLIQNDSDSVVEQSFSEYVDEEKLVDVDLFKDGDDGHWINGRDKGRKDEDLEGRELHGEEVVLRHEKKGSSDGEGVPESSDN